MAHGEPGPEPSASGDFSLSRLFGWRFLLSAAVTALVLAVLLRFVAGGLSGFQEILAGANWELMPAAFGFAALGLGLGIARWRLVLRAMDCGIGWSTAAYAVLAFWPAAALTPSRAAEMARGLIVRDRVPPWAGAGSVLVEKLVDGFTLATLAVIGALLEQRYLRLLSVAAIATAALIGLRTLLHHREIVFGWRWLRRIEHRLRALSLPFQALHQRPARVFGVFVCSTGVWLSSMSALTVLLRVFHQNVPPTLVVSEWPVAAFIGMIPVTLQGMGTRDAAFIELLTLHHPAADPSAVFAASFIHGLVVTWQWAVVGLPFMLHLATRGLPRRGGQAGALGT